MMVIMVVPIAVFVSRLSIDQGSALVPWSDFGVHALLYFRHRICTSMMKGHTPSTAGDQASHNLAGVISGDCWWFCMELWYGNVKHVVVCYYVN